MTAPIPATPATPPQAAPAPTMSQKAEKYIGMNKAIAQIQSQLNELTEFGDTFIANHEVTADDAISLLYAEKIAAIKQAIKDTATFGSAYKDQLAQIIFEATGVKTVDLKAKRLPDELLEHAQLKAKAEEAIQLVTSICLGLKVQVPNPFAPKPAGPKSKGLSINAFLVDKGLVEKKPVAGDEPKFPPLPKGGWLTKPVFDPGSDAVVTLTKVKTAMKLFKDEAALQKAFKAMNLDVEKILELAEEVIYFAQGQINVSTESIAKAEADTAGVTEKLEAVAGVVAIAMEVQAYLNSATKK